MSNYPILQIETATQVCSVALSVNGETVVFREVNELNVHASRLTLLITDVLQAVGLKVGELAAVAVSKGPGSYTGLRIGVSTAKGLCYAANLPLIGLDTLACMAAGFKEFFPAVAAQYTQLCPMIDARRMEVYLATYDQAMQVEQAVSAVVIDDQTFQSQETNGRIALFGSGADKLEALFAAHNGVDVIPGFLNSARYQSRLAYRMFQAGEFVDVAYFEPYYLKEFVSTKARTAKANPSA